MGALGIKLFLAPFLKLSLLNYNLALSKLCILSMTLILNGTGASLLLILKRLMHMCTSLKEAALGKLLSNFIFSLFSFWVICVNCKFMWYFQPWCFFFFKFYNWCINLVETMHTWLIWQARLLFGKCLYWNYSVNLVVL